MEVLTPSIYEYTYLTLTKFRVGSRIMYGLRYDKQRRADLLYYIYILTLFLVFLLQRGKAVAIIFHSKQFNKLPFALEYFFKSKSMDYLLYTSWLETVRAT